MKPIIALTCRIHDFDGQDRVYNNRFYFEAFQAAGAIPIIVPMMKQDEIERIADSFDGLCVTGGEDLDPALFNQEPHPSIGMTLKEIDETDIALVHAFLKRKKPILGICRGIQVINVALGGDLYQDIDTQYKDINPRLHQQNKIKDYPLDGVYHRCDFIAGSQMEKIFTSSAEVNSFHHQAIKTLAPALTLSGVSDDGLIEAVEIKDLLMAVQWHPERLIVNHPNQLELFKNFINLCKR